MKIAIYAVVAFLFCLGLGATSSVWSEENTRLSQMGHMEHQKQFSHPMNHSPHPKPDPSKLQPAEGAQVTILFPKTGQVIKGDEVPLHFNLIKGKRGDHVHAYIDGELMGMFKSEQGTLTGIKPGHHTLEVRVVAKDHQTELDATGTVQFIVE